MARDLGRALRDLAADAALANRERPLARLKPAMRELAAIADGLAATAARLAEARARHAGADALRRNAEAALALAASEPAEWRWTLASGAMDWSPAADFLFRAAGAEPSRGRLLSLAHPSSRADLVAWLALLARGDDAPPSEFRIARGDAVARTVRATATIERAADGSPIAIAGTFSDVGPAPLRDAPPEAADEVNALLQALAARMRARARAAGIDFGAAILPELGPAQGPAQKLAAALELLGESALTFTPRGGRVLLRADRVASGSVRISLACDRQAAPDGMEMAGQLVELNCGFLAAKRLEDARALVAAAGAQLAVEQRDGRDIVAIILSDATPARRAA
jgi:PAS domain-containing protein